MHEIGEYKSAAEHLKEVLYPPKLIHMKHFMAHALMLEARFAIDQGKIDAGLTSLRTALALGKEIGLYHNVIDSRSAITALCTIALDYGIEKEYVIEYIRRRSLISDTLPIHLENWPWPLKIYTLGRFDLVTHDEPVKFSRKAQQKPRSLFKALIAFGGRGVKEDQLSDAIWPDAVGDTAHQSYNITLHRLRKLINNTEAIQHGTDVFLWTSGISGLICGHLNAYWAWLRKRSRYY